MEWCVRLLLLGGLCLAACSKTEPAILVQVLFQDSPSACAKVAVKGLPFEPERTGPLRRDGGSLIKVGLSRTPELGDEVKVFAEGFLDGNCVGAPAQVSATQTVRFPASGVLVTSLVLGPLVVDGGVPDSGTPDGGNADSGFDSGTPDAGFDAGIADAGMFCFSCAGSGCEGARCEEGNACSGPDTCSGGICVSGPTRICPPANECQTGSASCLPDAGCGYLPLTGPCDGGECFNGGCVAKFSFIPSNFNPAIPAGEVSADQNLNCTDPTFDSTTLVFTNWCGTPPKPVEVNRPLIEGVVVLPMRGLTVAMGTTLHLKGTRPVILAVYGDAVIDGRISADSSLTVRGAGAGSLLCGANAQKGLGGDGSPMSGAGAGGAGFGKVGAGGGTGPNGAAGVGGLKSPGPLLTLELRGGCPGGDGAAEENGGNAAPGGQGGGAVQVSVSGKLTVRGVISALGNGGRSAQVRRGGGGGGGSGGAVLLEANSIRFEASKVVANGGGGGAGAVNENYGGSGTAGQVNDEPAPGGTSTVLVGKDGYGGRGGAEKGDAQNGNSGGSPVVGVKIGGGGGGGAVGRIHFRSITGCSASGMRVVSPAAEADNCN